MAHIRLIKCLHSGDDLFANIVRDDFLSCHVSNPPGVELSVTVGSLWSIVTVLGQASVT
jgi:hypothetical protein